MIQKLLKKIEAIENNRKPGTLVQITETREDWIKMKEELKKEMKK